MPFDLTPLGFAEAIVLLWGAIICAVSALHLTLSRRWRAAVQLAEPPDHDIQAVDLIVAIYVFLVASLAFYSLFDAIGGRGGAATPSTQPAGPETAGDPLRLLSTVAGQLACGTFLFVLGRRRFANDLGAWGLTARSLPRQIVGSVIIYIALWPLCSAVLQLTTWSLSQIQDFELSEHKAILTLREGAAEDWVGALTIISAVVLAPIAEELLFRGLLQPFLSRRLRSQWKAIVISGLAFGMIHLQVVHTAPPLVVFGIILGFVYARTRSLTLVILIHAVFNTKTVTWLVLARAA